MPETDSLSDVAVTAADETADLEQPASGEVDGSEAATSEAEGSEAAAAAEPSRIERLRALLDAVDPSELDEVARHPRVSGKIGAQADKLAQQRQAEAEQRRAEEARRKLRDEHPLEFAKRDREEEQQRLAREAELARLSDFAGGVHRRLEAYAREHLTPEELEAAGKASDGKPFDEGVLSWVQASTEASFERRYTERLKRELPGLQKRWLAEQNGGEPSPDVAAAPAAGSQRAPRTMDEANELFLADRISARQFRAYRRQLGG